MNKLNQELQKYLNNIQSYELTIDDKKMLELEGIEKYIYTKLSSSKFRSKSISKKLARFIRSVIKNAIESENPIVISVPFGGYKKWQYPTAPHVDWAEVFNIRYLIDYLKPIAAAYSGGVVLNYFSDEIFVSRMNNIPQQDIDTYNNEFGLLCEKFNQIAPAGLEIKFSKIRDSIDQQTLLTRFDKAIEKLKLEWDQLDSEIKETRLKKSARNYKGKLSDLTKAKQNEILLESTLVHDAFIFGDWEDGVHWAFESHMIPIGFRYTGEWGISLRSARGSAVQFWVGYGVVEVRKNGFVPKILTYQQFLKQEDSLSKIRLDNPFAGLDFLSEISLVSLRG